MRSEKRLSLSLRVKEGILGPRTSRLRLRGGVGAPGEEEKTEGRLVQSLEEWGRADATK